MSSMRLRSDSLVSTSLKPPPITACFLIRFDKRVGYVISWKRQLDIEIEGAVEFKSLPSGLHTVKDDLIFFKHGEHGEHAGLAAFAQAEASEAERNAQLIAVGILLPIGQSRFGRGWLHATQLKDLAASLVQTGSNDTTSLEDYWEANRCRLEEEAEGEGTECSRDEEARRHEGLDEPLSESVALASLNQGLSSDHPILAISSLLDELGPLIFPMYRMALLRHRILFVKKPPIRTCCEFVYVLSIISSIPPALAEELPRPHLSKTTPLFSICVTDIPNLRDGPSMSDGRDVLQACYQDEDPPVVTPSWIACTSDEIIATKPTLFDVRINLQNSSSVTSGVKNWPSVYEQEEKAVKATQRDMRRYISLRRGLMHLNEKFQAAPDVSNDTMNDVSSSLPLNNSKNTFDLNHNFEDSIVESKSWATVAYDSYMWWASAGEQSVDLQEEIDQDTDLLMTAADVWEDAEASAMHFGVDASNGSQSASSGALEMALVAYFHRMTKVIFERLVQLVEAAESSSADEGSETQCVYVSRDDLAFMGLDPLSLEDKSWVSRLIGLYFGKEVNIQGPTIECCGVVLMP